MFRRIPDVSILDLTRNDVLVFINYCLTDYYPVIVLWKFSSMVYFTFLTEEILSTLVYSKREREKESTYVCVCVFVYTCNMI